MVDFLLNRYNLLDMKINNVLTSCHDQIILSAVRSIIQNMIACEDTSQQQLHYLQSCGFGGLWRFAGPFNKVLDGDNAILFYVLYNNILLLV